MTSKTKCRLLPSLRSLIVCSITFGLAVPVLCAVLQLNHSPYYQCYLWFIHRSASGDLATVDRDLFTQLITENDDRLAAARKYLDELLPQRNGVERPSYSDENYFQRNGVERPSYSDENYLKSADNVRTNQSRKQKSSTTYIVMVTVISSGRETYIKREREEFQFSPNYIVQNIAMFLQLINDHGIHGGHYASVEYLLSVCSVGAQLTPEEGYLTRMVPVFRDQTATIDYVNRFDPWHDRLAWRYEKEKRDYSYCIRETLQRRARQSRDLDVSRDHQSYLLMVEDDALPKKHVLSVVDRLIVGHWTSRTESAAESSVTYAKLYHPKHLHGYISSEVDGLPQLIAMSSLLGTVLHVTLRFHRQPTSPDGSSWFQSCLYAGLLVLAIGKVNFDRWRSLFSPYAHYAVPDNLCCTQALLYSARTAAQLVDYLDLVNCNETFHKDDALWSFGQSTTEGAVSGLLIQPNLFKHVGFYSGLREQFLDPHIFISD